MVIKRDKYYKIANLVDLAHKISPGITSGLVGYFYDKRIDQSIYVKELNCIYMPIPKAGTKSIKKAFADYLFNTNSDERFNTSISDTKGLPFYKISKTEVELLKDNVFVFSFVRNPFQRILSCYFDKIRKKTSYKGFLRYKTQFNREMSFEEFVKKISRIPDSDADQHFRSQHEFLTDNNGDLIPHFTGKLEHIEMDFEKISGKMNSSNLKLKHINKSNAKQQFEKHFNPHITEMILERYKTDFQLFNYSYDIKTDE